MVLDLGKFDEKSMMNWGAVERACVANRAPPLVPAEFRLQLATKSFTSKKADEEMVNKLFGDEYVKRLGEVKELEYNSLKWTDADAVAVSEVIATGVLQKLESLSLNGNQIGDAGVMALAEAAGKGTLPQLEWLNLEGNKTISQQAQDALTAALPDCSDDLRRFVSAPS